MSGQLRAEIDRDVCQGHGRCAALLPQVFELDDDGYGVVKDDAEYPDRAELDRVASLCPELAITISGSDTDA